MLEQIEHVCGTGEIGEFEIHQSLGITKELLTAIGLPKQELAEVLVSAGKNIYGKLQYMHPAAYLTWQGMQISALEAGVRLDLISAYRSLEYQKILIERKLQNRQIEEILRSIAPPGYSEHHTGRAVDIATVDSIPLTESFAETAAFSWLNQYAADFNFYLSYPKENHKNRFMIYEPWHWCYRG